MEHPNTQPTNAPQIRSRITVVCAECKRLKLKCDRRSPCSSCTKRDTVARCIYSPAAAEKVDLHSLNNRLMQVETTLAQLTAGSFQSSYPPSHPSPNPPPSCRSGPFPPSSHHHHHHPAAVTSHVHDSPSSLALSLDELRAAWLDSPDSPRPARTAPGRPIKLELSPADLERQMRFRTKLAASTYPHSRHPNPQPFLPPINVYYPPLTQPYGSPSYTTPVPALTPSVLECLPSTSTCIRIFARAKPLLMQRPVPLPGGWVRFEQKAISLLNSRTASYTSPPLGSAHSSDGEADSGRPNTPSKRKAEEGLPFFAITTAVLAIGAALSPPEVFGSESINAGFLHALSQQALSIWESSSAKKSEKDYVLFLVACLAGIGYTLLVTQDTGDDLKEYDTRGKAKAIFASVGKMVNVAREIGLGKERAPWQEGEHETRPSSRPDARRPWEDFRRVVWFDVMFYDLFTSDALGQTSLIPPMSYSSRLPELAGNLYDPATKKYVLARCRLVQIAQHVKHRLSHPDCCCGYTFDQAGALEDEIRQWSRDSITQDDDDNVDERKHTWELSLAAQILILRVYVPFLISASSAAATKRQQQQQQQAIPLPPGSAKLPGKLSSSSTAYGDKSQPHIQGNAMAMATQSCLGAAQTILRLGNKLNVSLFKDQPSTNNANNTSSTLIGPLLTDLYPLERMVLDAVVITQSSTAVSVVSEAEVRRGMEILMDREFTFGKERKEIWEMMKLRVFAPSKLQIPGSQGQGGGVGVAVKRKHDQLSSPVSLVSGGGGGGNDVMSSGGSGGGGTKKSCEGPSAKHAKTSPGPLPMMGVRYRQGRMGPSGPIPQQQNQGEYEGNRSYTLSNAQNESSMNGAPHMQQQQQPTTMLSTRYVGEVGSSPAEFVNEQAQSLGGMSVEHSMTNHRSSFDASQPKSIYSFEEGPGPMPSPYTDYATQGASTTTHPNSSSSSPYQSATSSSSYNNNPPPGGGQMNSESPTMSYGGGSSEGGQRTTTTTTATATATATTFMGENSMLPPPSVFSSSQGHEGVQGQSQSPSESSIQDGAPSASAVPQPPTFGHHHPGLAQPQPQQPLPPPRGHDAGGGYYHPHHHPHHAYDAGGMLQIGGMRMDEGSVPGTPIIYEKAGHMQQQQQQHVQMMHQQHQQAHHQHSHSIFVGEQVQGLVGPPPSLPPPPSLSTTTTTASTVSWASGAHQQQQQQQLVGVGQPYW